MVSVEIERGTQRRTTGVAVALEMCELFICLRLAAPELQTSPLDDALTLAFLGQCLFIFLLRRAIIVTVVNSAIFSLVTVVVLVATAAATVMICVAVCVHQLSL